MSAELIITRFLVHGLALGFVMGFIDAWNKKVMAGLLAACFVALLVGGLTMEPSQFAKAAFPSLEVVIAQGFGAMIGYGMGAHTYNSAFDE